MKYIPKFARTLIPFFLMLSVTQMVSSATRIDEIAMSYPRSVSYVIKRKGKDIGTHSLTFERLSDKLNVLVESKINVKILGLSVFQFNYTAVETWDKKRLLSVEVTVNENGKKWNNSLSNIHTADKNAIGRPTAAVESTLSRNGKQELSELLSFSSNHWHSDVTEQSVLYNTLTGKPAKVQISENKTETLSLPVGNIAAKRYTYSGDIDASSWYDSHGRWVKLEFKAEDGNIISYNLNTQLGP